MSLKIYVVCAVAAIFFCFCFTKQRIVPLKGLKQLVKGVMTNVCASLLTFAVMTRQCRERKRRKILQWRNWPVQHFTQLDTLRGLRAGDVIQQGRSSAGVDAEVGRGCPRHPDPLLEWI